MTKDPIERLREELARPPLFSERNGYAPLDRAPLLGILDEIEAQYMRLPVDVDGVPVKPGDTLYQGEREIPGNTVYGVCDTFVYIWHYGGRSHITGVPADEFTHVKPDPVESIIDDLLADAGCEHHDDGSCEMGLTSEQITEYAERIKKAVCNVGE